MFRLNYLKLKGHKQLGDLELNLVDSDELMESEYPYTSVIIGPNGTGKSYILRTIAEIFRQLNGFKSSEQPEFNLPFDVLLKYRLNSEDYIVEIDRVNGKRKRIINITKTFLSRRGVSWNKSHLLEIKKQIIKHNELDVPERLIVSSVMPTDRFVYQKSIPSSFYQYLGARSTSSTASTKSSSRRTILHLFSASRSNQLFRQNLKDLLSFLKFEESLQVHYITKVNKLFFSGSLSTQNFKKFFEEWWDPGFEFTKRKRENPIWSIPYYNKHFKNDEAYTIKLVNYLNDISNEQGRLIHKPKSRSKIFPVNLFDEGISDEEIELISHLENLDIINLDGIKIRKNGSNLSIDEVSSGEYHLLISLIGIFANVQPNSLILIDEPEISLHPNWQMKYVTFLKNVFSKFSDCQFILTTHSHFLVSDLAGNSSSVIALKRNNDSKSIEAKLLEDVNTFGWSAEEVLYSVFNVRSSRNAFLEFDLTKLVTLINRGSNDFVEIRRIVDKISPLILTEGDPLNIIKEKAEKYLLKNNA